MRRSRIVQALFPIGLLTIVLFAGGCASPAPGQVGGAGKALIVTMMFNDYPDPSSRWYFFAINRYGATGDLHARGPVAVYANSDVAGSWGNGFATGSGGSTTGLPGGPANDYGLTDYVLIHTAQSTSSDAGLYHVLGDPNILGSPIAAMPEGAPAAYTPADPNAQDSTHQTITFRLNIQQLATDQEANASGQSKAQIAAAIRYLQVNIIATSRVPTGKTNIDKDTDAMGSPTSTSSDARGRFLIIDLTRVGQTYSSTDAVSNLPEQAGDVYPPGAQDPNVDLTYWSIQVVNVGG